MATTAGIGIHVEPDEISHHYHPADKNAGKYGTLDLGKPGQGAYGHLFFDDAEAVAAIDKVIAELALLKQEMDPPVLDVKAPEPEGNWCPATTGPDDELDQTLYCDRENGHPGSHHAPGPDEGSEVAWSDEPCRATRYGGIVCIRDKGHDGQHYDNTGAAHAWSDEPATAAAS